MRDTSSFGVIRARLTGRNNNRAMLDEHKRRLVQTLPELMKATGRLIAVSCATSTAPYGVGQNARKLGETAVRRDIARVYVSAGKVYKSFPNKGTADVFWFHMQNRRYAQAQIIMDKFHPNYRRVPIRAFDGGSAHQAARKNGKVPLKQRPVMIVQADRRLDTYIKKEVDHVGEAKGGWAAAAQAIGGSTRGLPQWVTRHARNGAALENYTGRVFRVTLSNQVRYATDALSPGEKQVAISTGINRFLRGQASAIVHGNSRRE